MAFHRAGSLLIIRTQDPVHSEGCLRKLQQATLLPFVHARFRPLLPAWFSKKARELERISGLEGCGVRGVVPGGLGRGVVGNVGFGNALPEKSSGSRTQV